MRRVPVSLPQDRAEPTSARAAEIRQMFASISRRYDFLNHFLSFGMDLRWRRRAAELTCDGETRQILDICGGTGDFALAYLNAASQECRVVVTDFCVEMLELARDKLGRAEQESRARVCQADALRLPFEDGQFDLACVAFGIRNVTDLEAGLWEMTRVVRPDGGKVVVLEFSQPRGNLFRAFYLFYLLKVLPWIGRLICGSKIDAYAYLPESVMAFESPEELSHRMGEAGLSSVRCVPLMLGAVTLHIGERGQAA